MSKPIILGINRNEGNVEIQIKKSEDVIDLLIHLNDYAKQDQDYHGHQNKDGTLNNESLLKGLSDSMIMWDNGDYRFQMFFGEKKVLIYFESEPKDQQAFIDKIVNFCEWHKP